MIQKSKTKNNLPYYHFLAMSTVALVSLYSSWMYKDSSEEASLVIGQQLNNLTQEWQNNTSVSLEFLTYGVDFITWLIYYCAIPTFAMMAMKINALIAKQAKYFLTRSNDEIELTGKINPAFIVASLIVGGFSELPLVKVALDSAKTTSAKINNFFTGLFDLSNYAYGGGEFISGINSYLDIGFFAVTCDNARSHYTWSQRKLLRHQANNIVVNLYDQAHKNFFDYGKYLKESITSNIQDSEEFLNLNQIISNLQKLKETKSTTNLQDFLKIIAPDSNTSNTLEFFENNLNQSTTFCENIIDILKNTPQFTKKASLYLGLAVISLAMLMNDIAAAYYAGFDVLKNPIGQKIIGIIAGVCTAMSSIGLALFGITEIKDFFLEDDSDLMKYIYPIRFILLSCAIAFMGIFSGGPTAVEGIKYVTRALTDLGYHSVAAWMPQVCEGLGFLGAGITDMPYAISLVSSLLMTCGEQLGDKNIKQLMSYMHGCQEIAFCIENMKVEHIDNLIKSNIFSKAEAEKDLNARVQISL